MQIIMQITFELHTFLEELLLPHFGNNDDSDGDNDDADDNAGVDYVTKFWQQLKSSCQSAVSS